ncbi:hypothetical protein V1460_25120 [Streptomyces sp. SCSIO 30461]|uniref:hypothetical protein n=1 Tax=Streptomyces sp. SCSIO 30461 TaxID=3118085 RepID=UPI0030CE28E5
MKGEIKDKLRRPAGKILLGGAGALLVLWVVTLGTGLLSDGPAASDTQADAVVQKLEGNLGDAQAKLATQHTARLVQLPGMDIERVNRDRATGRSLLLSLTDSSTSTRTVKEQQVLLDACHGFLDHRSRVLTIRTRVCESAAGPELLAHGGGSARSSPRRTGSEQRCQERVPGLHLLHLSQRGTALPQADRVSKAATASARTPEDPDET